MQQNNLKPFNDISDFQAVVIAKLALKDLLQWDFFAALRSNKVQEENWRIEREIWNQSKNPKDKREPVDLYIIRIYPDGMGDTYCAIWEEDGENHINVTAYDDKNEAEVANMCLIVKQLISWGFV
jgi:hypothetical protein